MTHSESIADFYKNKFDWIPERLRQEIGHFNVFKLEHCKGHQPQPVPYKRRDFYKVMLAKGGSLVYYADKVVEVKKQAICFSNPFIPYKWENLENIEGGYFCIYNDHFFNQFGNLNQYALFQPNGKHIFELNDEQYVYAETIFKRMFEEIQTDYVYKYDLLRNLSFELIHFALKLEPLVHVKACPINASKRIATLFLELLERQFPIDDTHVQVQLKSASDFAAQLNVHVNHLNKAMKEITQKTTTQIIAARCLQEAKILLMQSKWNVSEIAHALGFSELTHFNNFFKKHVQMSPLQFRKS